MPRFNEREDSRPVNMGDLVAARFFPDPDWRIGLVEPSYEFYGSCLDDADHVVLIMENDDFDRMIEEAGGALFTVVGKGFPEVRTGDFGPEDQLAFEKHITKSVITWLQWNHPGMERSEEGSKREA